MAKIIIQRTNEYNNRWRDYQIYIDNKKVGTIKNGGSIEFEIEEGKHIIEAKIDWCGSPKITVEIKNDETKYLKVGGFKYGNWILPIALILILFHFLSYHFLDFDYTVITYPTFFLLAYYLTIGRKKYLKLVPKILL